jgi:hypothetical protein
MFGLSHLPEFQENSKGEHMSYYVHHIPGRLRIKTPSLKGNPAKACELEQQLKAIYGAEAVYANALTGSVLINYDTGSVSGDEILDTISKAGHFDPARATTQDWSMEQHLSKAGSVIGRALLGIAIGELFEGSPLALLTAII